MPVAMVMGVGCLLPWRWGVPSPCLSPGGHRGPCPHRARCHRSSGPLPVPPCPPPQNWVLLPSTHLLGCPGGGKTLFPPQKQFVFCHQWLLGNQSIPSQAGNWFLRAGELHAPVSPSRGRPVPSQRGGTRRPEGSRRSVSLVALPKSFLNINRWSWVPSRRRTASSVPPPPPSPGDACGTARGTAGSLLTSSLYIFPETRPVRTLHPPLASTSRGKCQQCNWWARDTPESSPGPSAGAKTLLQQPGSSPSATSPFPSVMALPWALLLLSEVLAQDSATQSCLVPPSGESHPQQRCR